jgi:hypothetical protein
MSTARIRISEEVNKWRTPLTANVAATVGCCLLVLVALPEWQSADHIALACQRALR